MALRDISTVKTRSTQLALAKIPPSPLSLPSENTRASGLPSPPVKFTVRLIAAGSNPCETSCWLVGFSTTSFLACKAFKFTKSARITCASTGKLSRSLGPLNFQTSDLSLRLTVRVSAPFASDIPVTASNAASPATASPANEGTLRSKYASGPCSTKSRSAFGTIKTA